MVQFRSGKVTVWGWPIKECWHYHDKDKLPREYVRHAVSQANMNTQLAFFINAFVATLILGLLWFVREWWIRRRKIRIFHKRWREMNLQQFENIIC